MPASGYAPWRRPRWGTLACVALLHLLLLAGLVRVFTPGLATAAITETAALVTVTVTAPPEPEPKRVRSSERVEGGAGDEGREATPTEEAAPPPPLPRPQIAPRAFSPEDQTGAAVGEHGQGSGAGSAGEGAGSGGSGARPAARGRPLELISGAINNARDYPIPAGGRRARRGQDVVIELTVGADGRVTNCRVTDPSPDLEADAITCQLASERFVFRPRLDGAGERVTGLYRWRQRWF